MSGPSTVDVLARLLPSLVVIVGALLLARWWARRSSAGPRRPVRVLTRAPLTKGAVIAVVAVAGRRLVVGASEHGVTLLTELDEGAPLELPDADTDVASAWPPGPAARTAYHHDRPRTGPIHRLREMTVRQPVQSRLRWSFRDLLP